MSLDFRTQMFGGNKRKIKNQPVIEAVLHELEELTTDKRISISTHALKILKKLERREQ